MSVEVKDVFAGKEYPSWIKNHKVFKKHPVVKKIFPEIGLVNCEKEIDIDNSKEAKQFAEALRDALLVGLNERIRTIRTHSKRDGLSKERVDGCLYIVHLLEKVKNSISLTKTLNSNSGKLSFNLVDDIVDLKKETVFKAGERVFSVYGKLNEMLPKHGFIPMENLDNLDAFKEFSAHNVPAVKYKVVFSSDGSDGMWDIATMSMRGVSSCQTWGSGPSTGLIGSLVDPFTGIIYMTSGSAYNEYGSKMIRRCVVRYCLDAKKKPIIMLERMYPQVETAALKEFRSFIQEKVGKGIEVIYFPNNRKGGLSVPMSKAITSLPNGQLPYRDSGVQYVRPDVSAKVDWKVCENIASKVITSIREMKKDCIDTKSKKAVDNVLCPTNIHGYVNLHETASALLEDVKDYKSFLGEVVKEPNKILVPCIKGLNRGAKKNKISDQTLDNMVKASTERIVKYFESELAKSKPKISVEQLHTKFLD